MDRDGGRLDFEPNITLKSSADLEPKENSNGMFGGPCCVPIIMVSNDEEEFEQVTETHVELPSPQSIELSSGSCDDVVFLESSSNDDLEVHDDAETSPALKRWVGTSSLDLSLAVRRLRKGGNASDWRVGWDLQRRRSRSSCGIFLFFTPIIASCIFTTTIQFGATMMANLRLPS